MTQARNLSRLLNKKLQTYKFTATSGQTSFTDSDDAGNVLSYTPDNMLVTYNGVVLENGSEYTATNGTSVILDTGADSAAEVNVYAFESVSLGGYLDTSTGGSVGGNVSVTGTVTADALTVDTNTLYVDATNDRIGINTTSLTSTLTLQGNEIGGQTLTHLHLNSGNNTTDYPFLASVNADSVASSTYGWLFRNSSDNGNLEIYRKNNSTTPAIAMSISRNTGALCVGDTEPAAGSGIYALGGGVTIAAEGTGQGYVEGSYLSIAPDNYRGGGLYMANRQNGGTANEWYVGRIYTDASDFHVCYSGSGSIAGPTAQFSARKFTVYQNGNYYFTGSNVSDERRKQDITLESNQLQNVLALTPKTFKYKGQIDGDTEISPPSDTKHGLIAQEVREILPNLVTGDDTNENEFLGVDYNGLTSVLVKAIQEQQEIIEELKARLDAAGL